jgi:hypothetical protein
MLVLVDDAGRALGVLPSFEASVPWWMDTTAIADGARAHHGADVAVLRILTADRPKQPGGTVVYAAQAADAETLPLKPVPDDLRALAETDHPLRADYARPGGPLATVAWATDELGRAGRGPVTAARQQRTWNLSSIWRLDTATGPAWIKEVPPFFGHEPAVLRWLVDHGHAALAPSVIATDGRRMLLDHIPGEDLYGTNGSIRHAIAADMHAIQVTATVDTLLAIGLPDRRDLTARLTEVIQSSSLADDPRLRGLVDGLAERLAQVASCGLPDTLVHGDLHPGNVIGTADGRRVILDWGDSVVGNPALDIVRLTDGLPYDEAASIQREWSGWWREAVPGCDPDRAITLLRPLIEVYYASIYADFLRGIEPSEHPYHREDVPDCLGRAAEQAS